MAFLKSIFNYFKDICKQLFIRILMRFFIITHTYTYIYVCYICICQLFSTYMNNQMAFIKSTIDYFKDMGKYLFILILM